LLAELIVDFDVVAAGRDRQVGSAVNARTDLLEGFRDEIDGDVDLGTGRRNTVDVPL